MRAMSSNRVAVSEHDIQRFCNRWPASGLRGLKGVTFEFDRKGDLVDIHYANGNSERWDGPALSALSQDAQAYLNAKTKRKAGGGDARTKPMRCGHARGGGGACLLTREEIEVLRDLKKDPERRRVPSTLIYDRARQSLVDHGYARRHHVQPGFSSLSDYLVITPEGDRALAACDELPPKLAAMRKQQKRHSGGGATLGDVFAREARTETVHRIEIDPTRWYNPRELHRMMVRSGDHHIFRADEGDDAGGAYGCNLIRRARTRGVRS